MVLFQTFQYVQLRSLHIYLQKVWRQQTFLADEIACLGSREADATVAGESFLDDGELGRHVRNETKKAYEAEGRAWVSHPAEAVIDRMCVELGRKGKAAGAGFYEYPAGGKKHLWPGLFTHFMTPEHARPTESKFQEMKDRLLYIPAIETIRCLEEGVLRSVADANIGSVMGIGAPPWTGGLLQFVNYVGLREFVTRAQELARKHGDRFTPPKTLVEMAERGETFQ